MTSHVDRQTGLCPRAGRPAPGRSRPQCRVPGGLGVTGRRWRRQDSRNQCCVVPSSENPGGVALPFRDGAAGVGTRGKDPVGARGGSGEG